MELLSKSALRRSGGHSTISQGGKNEVPFSKHGNNCFVCTGRELRLATTLTDNRWGGLMAVRLNVGAITAQVRITQIVHVNQL